MKPQASKTLTTPTTKKTTTIDPNLESPGGYFSGADQELKPLVFKGGAAELDLMLEQSFQPSPSKKLVKTNGTKTKTKLKVKRDTPVIATQVSANYQNLEGIRHLITNVVDVDPEQSNLYKTNLRKLTSDFTNFLLTEIAPYESALDAALEDAGESLRIVTGLDTATFSFGRAETLLRRLPELKTLDWICNYWKIPDDIRSSLIEEYIGRKTPNDSKQELLKLLFPNGLPKPQEGSRVHMQRAQTRAFGRPTMDSSKRKA